MANILEVTILTTDLYDSIRSHIQMFTISNPPGLCLVMNKSQAQTTTICALDLENPHLA